MSLSRKTDARLPIAVLASGEGTNLQALLDAARRRSYPARVAVVLSDHPEAKALDRARRVGVPAVALPVQSGESREHYDRRWIQALRSFRPQLVALAGFMRILSPVALRAYPNRILNIHPALLPSFPGLDAQRRAFERGVRFSGATVHVVNEGVDAGPIVIQAAVAVLASDTAESLRLRILEQEHRIYPWAVRAFAEGRIRVRGGRVTIQGARPPKARVLFHPALDR